MDALSEANIGDHLLGHTNLEVTEELTDEARSLETRAQRGFRNKNGPPQISLGGHNSVNSG